MDSKLYRHLYESLNSHDDVLRLSREHDICCGTLSSILNQKVVKDVKNSHHRFKRKEDEIIDEWHSGHSLLTLSKKYNYPAALVSALVLERHGNSKKRVRALCKEPKSVEDERIQKELIESLNADYFFSPRAHQLQEERGRIGENIVSFWLKMKSCDFICEEEIRASGSTGKTPDFLLRKPVKISEREVYWIESKALFGDLKEHRNYEKRQYKEYTDYFGEGLVVYWFGYETNILKEKRNGYQITDFGFFQKDVPEHVAKLLNYVIHW